MEVTSGEKKGSEMLEHVKAKPASAAPPKNPESSDNLFCSCPIFLATEAGAFESFRSLPLKFLAVGNACEPCSDGARIGCRV